jgi:hypothetical protein
MIAKEKGTIAEYSVALKALKKGWGVSVPLGDHAAYDLIFDVADRLVKIQVKSAWFDQQKQNFVVDNRRTKTNRRHIKRENYTRMILILRFCIYKNWTFAISCRQKFLFLMGVKYSW